MTNQVTENQLQELLQIQKNFDSRIPTLNLQDSKIAYVVEFFEWFNTLETFKNWKKKPGKPLDIQLDELADMLAFGFSIANQTSSNAKEIVELIKESFKDELFKEMFDFNNKEFAKDAILGLPDLVYNEFYPDYFTIVVAFDIAYNIYSIDQLIDAYKKKMKLNHARQDGIADINKGYV
ncbi:dUTPase [Staphylococcus epidermidis]|nr:dUTPase [Staphylococcus epidermidis]MCG2004719.1 dUTPase [Staphylococcus epidermidis]MCG2042951.1 dUTPase [Staphylococcus epidermidis]